MTKYVALLRGINVGGKASVPMKELCVVCRRLGWENVTTYLRTGNVVFDTSLKAAQLEEALEYGITKEFGLSVPVIIKSGNNFSVYLSNVPFSLELQNDPSHVIMYFSKSTPAISEVDALLSKASAGESVIQKGDTIWIYYPKGIARSKITPAVIDRSIGSPATGRNWNTLIKIQALCRSD